LQLLDDRAFDSGIRLAPVAAGLTVSGPGLAHPVTAGKADFSVNDEYAMLDSLKV
jgi:hypothetical protein